MTEPPLRGGETREKELSGGQESAGKFPPGEIDAIAIFIELDIITIIIIIISTIYTAISTAASRHHYATIAKSRQIENTETPNAATPVNSPESVEYSSDDLDEDYVELDNDFIEKCKATTDARKIKKLLAEHAVRYTPSPDPIFATSPINIRDKDYDFSLDLSHIAIVEKTPFCGTEKESAVEHLTELSTLSGVFSDDVKMRTYFVAKNFPFSLKDDAKTWYNNLPPGSIKSPTDLRDVFFRKYFPASAQHAALQRIYNFDQEDGEKLPEAWARFCSLIRAQPDHDLEKHDLLDIFYSGLTIESRAYLDSCAGCVFRKRTPDDAEELLAKIGRNHDDWSTPEPTPTPIVKKRGMIKLNDEDMREAKKSLKEKGIKPEDVKNLPPIEDICETIPPSSMIEDFEFHRSRTDPMVRYKIYNKTIDLPFSDFCTAIRVPQWGSCEKIRGTPRELSDLYTRICNGRSLSNDGGISMNEVRKKLFTISLSGKAAHWYKLLKNGDSIDWEDIVPLFYSKFYPPSEIHKDRNRIYNFWPHDGESIAQAWGRLKSLMLKCPIHELPGNVIIDNFYARLSFQDKTLLDTSCSGSFTRNKEEFKRDLLDRIQENTEGWENDKDRESVKDLVTENVEDGHIIFCEDASNIVSHPNKPKQVSVPMLSVRIGDHCYYGLCDIGASVSAIPYELYTEIMHEIGSCELEDIDVVIHLANRETISPIGIVRDVEVLCGKIKYPADFLQHLENSESEAFRKERDELEEIFLRQPILKHDLPVEDLGTTPPPKEDPVFDLKPLPDNLKYAHIDDKKIYPVIISSKLSEIEEERLLEILKKHRGAIGYTLDDLKGISPSICQHAINMEEDAKPVVEHQRRLIPKMKEVMIVEVFMDDFSVYGNSFDNCLRNLDKVLQRCEETNLVLNWEKCNFMVNEGIVLGHKISERGIEVDRAKVEAIEKMPYPRDVKDRKGVDNPVADNLSRLENITYDPVPVNDSFPNEQLAVIKICFLSRSTMVSNNKDKGPLEEDIQDPELEEEVESEDEEEAEETPREHPRATIASIGVISNPSNTNRSARIATGGGVPRRYLAPRTSSPGNYRPFRNLIYDRQTERTPKVVLPSGWDIDRSNIAGETKPEAEGWGNNSKSWDSPSDMLMSRVEHNSELIRNLTYEIEDLKELVKKLVEKNPPSSPPKE
ncbi:hypothetical protein QYE76_026940 [Lolium multiflorum]|uniref:Retrotransposon gag domain-containing protein n=1 Tax=Lolium multiflorum TaxID=4521 RepID=A0AAD8VDY2_LOLMU|nr:hypothetical protein QYE76_026940 [Lolium multiflorum]